MNSSEQVFYSSSLTSLQVQVFDSSIDFAKKSCLFCSDGCSGKSQVRCLYPNQNSEVTFSVEDAFGNSVSENHGSSMVKTAI